MEKLQDIQPAKTSFLWFLLAIEPDVLVAIQQGGWQPLH